MMGIQAQCAYIRIEEGIIVCGAPVGSIQFQRRYVNLKWTLLFLSN